MDAQQIRRLETELAIYLREFDDCFGRVEPARHLRTYVRGQLSDLHRKSIEPMADAASVKPRDLQHFQSLKREHRDYRVNLHRSTESGKYHFHTHMDR